MGNHSSYHSYYSYSSFLIISLLFLFLIIMTAERVSIKFILPNHWFQQEEKLWGIKTNGTKENEYMIESIPFLAYGVNKGDIIQVERQGEEYIASKLIKKNGHETIRCVFLPDHIKKLQKGKKKGKKKSEKKKKKNKNETN